MDYVIGQIFEKHPGCDCAMWCNQNHALIVKKDGAYLIEAVPQPEITAADYDNAMEEYLTETRIARGYTTREPDCYLNSTNARWKQDAADWIAFRDAVMEYGLAIMNEYAETGIAPSLADFKAGLPVMEWSAE